ncbi:hypothetical protein PG985_008321 [Apiospora marii]|uniref:Uncharacterized protein n=1 Tax=Apiospora marii TaxID=335849 RepID=A0ABR1SRL7_9PEZI
MNIVTPAEGKKERVQEMLSHLCAEVEKHEPGALMFCASWCAAAGAFYVVEMYVEGTYDQTIKRLKD